MIQGHSDSEKTKILTQSPTIQRASQRLLLAIAPSLQRDGKYLLELRDITQAYPQAMYYLHFHLLPSVSNFPCVGGMVLFPAVLYSFDSDPSMVLVLRWYVLLAVSIAFWTHVFTPDHDPVLYHYSYNLMRGYLLEGKARKVVVDSLLGSRVACAVLKCQAARSFWPLS